MAICPNTEGSPQSPAATEVQTSPKSHREPADDAGAPFVLVSGLTFRVGCGGSCWQVGVASPDVYSHLGVIRVHVDLFICSPSRLHVHRLANGEIAFNPAYTKAYGT